VPWYWTTSTASLTAIQLMAADPYYQQTAVI